MSSIKSKERAIEVLAKQTGVNSDTIRAMSWHHHMLIYALLTVNNIKSAKAIAGDLSALSNPDYKNLADQAAAVHRWSTKRMGQLANEEWPELSPEEELIMEKISINPDEHMELISASLRKLDVE